MPRSSQRLCFWLLLSINFSGNAPAQEIKPQAAPSAGPYDALIQYAGGTSPSDVAVRLNSNLKSGELSARAQMDATAWLGLYFNSVQDRDRAAAFHGQYLTLPNREHDGAFDEDHYLTNCPDCSGQGRVAYDCPSCKGGKHSMSMSSSVRTCPGCNGAGFLKKTCPVCRGKGKLYSAKAANEHLAAFTRNLLLRRAEPDPAAFTGNLRAENRAAFIQLYLASKITPVPINGRVLRVMDENTVLIRRNRTIPDTICLRAKGHACPVGSTVQRVGYAVEPYALPETPDQPMECYSTDPVHGAVMVIGLDALALLYEARDRPDATPVREHR